MIKLLEIHLDEIYEKNGTEITDTEKYSFMGIGTMVFESQTPDNKTQIVKPIFKTKIPRTLQYIQSFKGNEIYLKEKGTYSRYNCKEISISDEGYDFTIQLEQPQSKKQLDLKKEDIILKFSQLYNLFLRAILQM